jgi:transposase
MAEANSPPEPFSEVAGSAAESRGFVAEAVRKALLTTAGALFLTEEGARRLAREWKLPKDLATYVVSQAKGAKDELLRVVGQEMRRFFQSEAFRRELAKLLGSMVIEVKAEIRLGDAKGRPEIRSTVKSRPARPEREGEPREG